MNYYLSSGGKTILHWPLPAYADIIEENETFVVCRYNQYDGHGGTASILEKFYKKYEDCQQAMIEERERRINELKIEIEYIKSLKKE